MWQWLASFLTAPIINGFLDGYKAKLASNNTEGAQAVEVTRAALLGEVEARKEARTIIIAEQGRWWTAAPRAVVQWAIAVFVAKCIIYDKVLGLGSTEPLAGDIAEWGGWVMAMWFGGRTVEKVASTIWSSRK